MSAVRSPLYDPKDLDILATVNRTGNRSNARIVVAHCQQGCDLYLVGTLWNRSDGSEAFTWRADALTYECALKVLSGEILEMLANS